MNTSIKNNITSFIIYVYIYNILYYISNIMNTKAEFFAIIIMNLIYTKSIQYLFFENI